MNRTTRAGLGLTLVWLLLLSGSLSSFGLTPVQFTGTETNAQLQRIITLVVVPPSTEQQRGTNIVIQPNVTVKPTTTNYPVVYLTSADYDVYLAGIKQFFRIAVPDTNILQQWDLLVKGGLTTYNYTNPIPQIFLTNGSAGDTLYVTNLYITTNFTDVSYVTNLYVTTNISEVSIITNLFATNIFGPLITNNYLYTTNVTINFPGGETNLNLTPLRLVQSDINDAMASVPDGVGALFNTGGGGFSWYDHFVTDLNGKLTNASFWGIAEFDELEVDRAFLTNTFTFLTNVAFLTTDGNGQLIPGSGTITNSTTIVQNFYSTYITNLVEYSTNLYVTTNFTSVAYITNLYATNITSLTNNSFVSYITNLYATNLTVFTNNSFFSYVTNLFVTTNITDVAYITNLYTTNITAKNVTVETIVVLTNLTSYLVVTNGITNLSLSASQPVFTDANKRLVSQALISPGFLDLIRATNNDSLVTNYSQQIGDASTNYTVTATNTSAGYARTLTSQATNEVTRQINSGTNIYTPLGSALSGIESATNLSYIIKTNNGGGNALVAGSPGTALTCILTNITAATTLGAMTFWTAGMSVIPVYASCSGGTDRALKFPANFQGSGDLYGIDLNGTGVTITNGEASWFEVRCIYGVKTNVFRSNTK